MTDNLGADLSVGPRPTLLPSDHPDVAVRAALLDGGHEPGTPTFVETLRGLAAAHPDSSLAWALLARTELDGLALDAAAEPADAVTAYAYARVGYHRGLDALRRAGWRGQGPVPVSHEANRGFLAALIALGAAAARIGEHEEAARIADFIDQSDPSAPAVLADAPIA